MTESASHRGEPQDRAASQALRSRNSCTSFTAIEPSPTADATRLIDPRRTSPAARVPGQFVSRKCGLQSGGGSAGALSRAVPANTNPFSPSATADFSPSGAYSQSVQGAAPMKLNSAGVSMVVRVPSWLFSGVTAVSDPPRGAPWPRCGDEPSRCRPSGRGPRGSATCSSRGRRCAEACGSAPPCRRERGPPVRPSCRPRRPRPLPRCTSGPASRGPRSRPPPPQTRRAGRAARRFVRFTSQLEDMSSCLRCR